MSGRGVGRWPTRILLVIAVTLLSVCSVAATPSPPVLAEQGRVRYAYDGTNREPEAPPARRAVHAPDQRILADGTAFASSSRGYDDRAQPASPLARLDGYRLGVRACIDWPHERYAARTTSFDTTRGGRLGSFSARTSLDRPSGQ